MAMIGLIHINGGILKIGRNVLETKEFSFQVPRLNEKFDNKTETRSFIK